MPSLTYRHVQNPNMFISTSMVFILPLHPSNKFQYVKIDATNNFRCTNHNTNIINTSSEALSKIPPNIPSPSSPRPLDSNILQRNNLHQHNLHIRDLIYKAQLSDNLQCLSAIATATARSRAGIHRYPARRYRSPVIFLCSHSSGGVC